MKRENFADGLIKRIFESQQRLENKLQPVNSISGTTTVSYSDKKIPTEKTNHLRIDTDLTRINPFFPMSNRNVKDRQILGTEGIRIKTNWGEAFLHGWKLSVSYDEKLLFALLSLSQQHKSIQFMTSTYELCKIMRTSISGQGYNAVWKGLKRLQYSGIEIHTKDYRNMSSYLDIAIIEKESNKLFIKINSFFKCLVDNNLLGTTIDLQKRDSLKGDITKNIYKFLQGQKGFHQFQIVGPYKLIDIAQVCNLDIDQKISILKQQIQKALDELIKKQFLDTGEITKHKGRSYTIKFKKKYVMKETKRLKDPGEFVFPNHPDDPEPKLTANIAKLWMKRENIKSLNKKEIDEILKISSFFSDYIKKRTKKNLNKMLHLSNSEKIRKEISAHYLFDCIDYFNDGEKKSFSLSWLHNSTMEKQLDEYFYGQGMMEM